MKPTKNPARQARALCSWLTSRDTRRSTIEQALAEFDQDAVRHATEEGLIAMLIEAGDRLLTPICDLEDRRPHRPADNCHCYCLPASLAWRPCGHGPGG